MDMTEQNLISMGCYIRDGHITEFVRRIGRGKRGEREKKRRTRIQTCCQTVKHTQAHDQ